MHQRNAFTLFELLISMVIISIVITFASQNYQSIYAQQALVARAQQLYQFLNLAKSQAIKNNQQVFVLFCQEGTSEVWRMALSDQNNCDCFERDILNADYCAVNGEQFNQPLTDGHYVFIQEVTFSGRTFTSYNAMRFSTSAGRVILTASDNKHALKVKQSIMRISICGDGSAQLGYPKC